MENVKWAPKAPQALIRRLYEADAAGFEDTEALEEAAMALYARCQSIIEVTAAHEDGVVRCRRCGGTVLRAPDGDIDCPCGWHMTWEDFHRSYRKKQLYGANAKHIFRAFVEEYPRQRTYGDKMLCVDRLLHAFHSRLQSAQAAGEPVSEALETAEEGRPVAANLVEGDLRSVIGFLDALSASPSADEWRRRLSAISWAPHFYGPDNKNESPA